MCQSNALNASASAPGLEAPVIDPDLFDLDRRV
jgi:hypothetical protein